MVMIVNQLFRSLTDTSLFDTYLLYGIIGLLVFIALIGLIVLLITLCYWCFYSISFCCCCCCYPRPRHLSYQLNEKYQKEQSTKKPTFLKRQSSDITDFSQLYDSCPHLINNKVMLKTGINQKNLETSCTTINTLVTPISPCRSLRSFIESASPLRKNRVNRPFSYIKKFHDRAQISHQHKPSNHSNSPAVVALDITRISSSANDPQTHSPGTNIYETVTPTTNLKSSSDRVTPIYEAEWRHHLQKLMMKKIPTNKNTGISVIELPSSSPPDLVPSIHYFQQKQHPYDKFLANRKKTSDSMRRAHMLKRLKDDAAFLY